MEKRYYTPTDIAKMMGCEETTANNFILEAKKRYTEMGYHISGQRGKISVNVWNIAMPDWSDTKSRELEVLERIANALERQKKPLAGTSDFED